MGKPKSDGKRGVKKLSSPDREDFGNSREKLEKEKNGNGEVKKRNGIQKSQAVKLAADRLLFVWSFFSAEAPG